MEYDVSTAWYLTGPTASGKSAIALALAERLDAEILSLDSMAIYRGMDIGTAKPGPCERERVPHHLIDLVDPGEEFSLAEYVQRAKAACAEIAGRGRQPLFVGGTPLYLKALLRGIFEGPPADWALREQLEAEADATPESLHRQLVEVDPEAAARLHPNDRRRLIRALEVYRSTGTPISQLQAQFEVGRPAEACRVFCLDWPRDVLHCRINQRVGAMLAAGLVDEVRGLLGSGDLSRTASQAVGYREVIDYLEGRCDLAAARERTQARTRQLARRQLTWFRSLSECRLVPLAGEVDAAEIAAQIAAAGSR